MSCKISTEQYAKVLRANIDRNCASSLICSLGKELNDRIKRMLKSDVIDSAIADLSNGVLTYVDEVSRDFRDSKTLPNESIDIENKFSENMMFTNAKKQPKTTITVLLKNTMGKEKGTNIFNPADFLMLTEPTAMAIIAFDDIKDEWKERTDGQIILRPPFDALTIVYKSDDVTITPAKDTINFKEEIQAPYVKRLIENVR